MKYTYIAVVAPYEDGTGYLAEVPDISGCITSGKDFDDAVDMVKDALAGCLCVLEDHYVQIESATQSANALVLEENYEGQQFVYVEVDTDEYRKEFGA